MRILGLVSITAMAIIGLIVCGRMLMLAYRTREIPEFAMGGGLLSIMVLGAPLSGIAQHVALRGTDLGVVLQIVGLLFCDIGIWLLFLFTWKVFRPNVVWVRSLVYGLAIFLVCLSIAQLSIALGEGTRIEIRARTRPYGITFIAVVIINFLWASIESFAFYRQMSKRLALGLADRVVLNRFLLWGIGGGAAVATCLGLMVLTALGGDLLHEPAGQLVLGIGASSVATCWCLTFLPPKTYVAWIEQRSS